MKKIAAALAVTAASLLSVGAMVLPASAQAQAVIELRVAPPPPRHEQVPPPRKGYVWAPGHYEARGNHYAWKSGYWQRARPGYAYHAPRWDHRGDKWVYAGGGWDRDGDGVPNNHDRHPDNTYRR